MKKSKSVIALIVIFACIVLLGYYSFGTMKSTVSSKDDGGIELGLDLAGGVSITYQAVGDTPSADDMADTIYKLQRRVESYSTESQVYQQGDDRIAVEIPGVTDANEILEELGTPGSLEFQTPDGETFMTGDDVADAQAASSGSDVNDSGYVVNLTLTDEGAEIFAQMTEEYLNQQLSIVFDDEVISAPTVQSVISGGECQITGMESYEDAEQLASLIRVGSLSVELEEIQSEVVSPQLGADAIKTSVEAAVVGVIIILIFMMVVYAVPGVAAAIALALYGILLIAVIDVFDVTLTLPGIAGVILSVGMAVDANVIIFARIREEIAEGRSVNMAIKTGFKKGLSAIIDGNITTLIAAAVLGARGSGSVRGFAATLAIGIILSMFTALVITRLLLFAFYGLGAKNPKLYKSAKKRRTIDFIGKRGAFYCISLAVIVAGFITMGVSSSGEGNALNYSLEFVGGTSTTVAFDEDYTIEEIDEIVVPVVEQVTGDSDIQTQKVTDSTSVVIKTGTLDLDQREELATALEENFGVTEEDIQTTSISSTISSEMRSDALWAVIIAVILMLIYIWFRFRDIRYASSAVFALVHDVLIVLACYAFTRISVGGTFIAVMLTLIGYSINDTIVIFDRFRENLANMRRERDATRVKDAANRAITLTIGRSINTSLTTFIMVFVLYIFGVSSIKDFTLPLIVGVISGTYSSIAIAGSLWYTMKLKLGKNHLIIDKEAEEAYKVRNLTPAVEGAENIDESSDETQSESSDETIKSSGKKKNQSKKKKSSAPNVKKVSKRYDKR